MRARLLIDLGVDADDDVRRAHQMPEAFGGERRDLGERLAPDELGGQLFRDRDRHLDRLRLHAALDRLHVAGQPFERGGDGAEGTGQQP
jgi:hypothetical protein